VEVAYPNSMLKDISICNTLAGLTVAGPHGSSMDPTSLSLLRRLQSDAREIAWERFVELCAPLIYHWGRARTATDTSESTTLSSTQAENLPGLTRALVLDREPNWRWAPPVLLCFTN
jgi:hypothetical protein